MNNLATATLFTINNQNKCLSHCSNGTQNLFFLFADITRRSIILNHSVLKGETIKETQGVIIIDDLEMGLDAERQTKIISVLRNTFPKMQFFCTTQSESMIAQTNNDNDPELRNIIDLSQHY